MESLVVDGLVALGSNHVLLDVEDFKEGLEMSFEQAVRINNDKPGEVMRSQEVGECSHGDDS